MHSAFRPCAVVEIPKERIDVILAYGIQARIRLTDLIGDKLLVGTSIGTLRIFQVQEPDGTLVSNRQLICVDALDVSATLIKTVEKFSKRIEQFAIIKEVGILVALAGITLSLNVSDSDATVSLYDLQSFELQEQLAKTKGATVFAITSNIEKDSDGVPTIISRLAISVKRKLLIYSWHDTESLEPEVSPV